MGSQLVIKAVTPWKYWSRMFLAVFSIGVFGWLMFGFGGIKAGYDNETMGEEMQRLQQHIYDLGRSNSDLREKIAVAKQGGEIDKQAYSQVKTSLVDLQTELLELKQQVAFYQGILSPKEAASGLKVTSLKLNSIGSADGYRFKLVLTHVNKHSRMVTGRARIFVEGIMEGANKTLSLADVSGGKLSELKLKFKYFQNLEGDIVLPKGFVPSGVLVDLMPSNKGMTRIKKNFTWTDIIG
ncbi:MAG: hypothetical protein OEZ68_08615 [Gammaproteobacteria bacterium]|nr:hypothetical protein [Gammaproteobacteria bacterium]MDH5800851.1 hypothetical protein [Gammaproteobacteria bacterium]